MTFSRSRDGTKGGTAILLIVFVAICIFLYALSWNPVAAGFLSDDAVYLLMADRFSPYHAADPALSAYVMRQSLFPPFYPLMLAWFGGGSGELLWSHVLTTSTLVVALVAFAAWIHTETRDRWATFGLVATYALLPGTLLHNLEILSEFPYLMFSMLALWLASRADTTHGGHRWVALFAGLAAVTRTAGLSLVAATVLWLFRERDKRRMLCIMLAIAPGFIWFFYKSLYVGQTSGYQQLWADPLQQARIQGVATFVPAFIASQFAALWNGFVENLDLHSWPVTHVIAAIIVLMGIPEWVARLRRGRLDAWYLLIGGGMTLLYPFPSFSMRLVMPWIPMLLFYFWLSASKLALSIRSVAGATGLRWGVLAMLAVAWAPSLVFIASRFAAPVEAGLSHWKHTRYWFRGTDLDAIRLDVAFRQSLIIAARGIADHVPNGQCVLTAHTAIAMLYGHRIAQQPPSPSAGDLAEKLRVCPYLLLVSSPASINGERVDAYYPGDRLTPGTTEPVAVWADPIDAEHPTAILLHAKPSA